MADGVHGAKSSFHTYKPQHTSAAWGGACLRLRSTDNSLKLPLSTNNFYKTPKHLPFTSVTNLNKSLAIKKFSLIFVGSVVSLCHSCADCVLGGGRLFLEERVVSVTGE